MDAPDLTTLAPSLAEIHRRHVERRAEADDRAMRLLEGKGRAADIEWLDEYRAVCE